MDAARFDSLARGLAAGRTRRGLIRGLGAAALGGLGLARLGGAAARDDGGGDEDDDQGGDGDRDCKPAGKKCRKDAQCCAGLACDGGACAPACGPDGAPCGTGKVCSGGACVGNGACAQGDRSGDCGPTTCSSFLRSSCAPTVEGGAVCVGSVECSDPAPIVCIDGGGSAGCPDGWVCVSEACGARNACQPVCA